MLKPSIAVPPSVVLVQANATAKYCTINCTISTGCVTVRSVLRSDDKVKSMDGN